MTAQRKESIWGSVWGGYRKELYRVGGGGLRQERYLVDIIGAARTLGIVGVGVISTGFVVESLTEKTPLRGFGKVTGRTIAVIGLGALGFGVYAEVMGRKALSIWGEVRTDLAIKRQMTSLKDQTERYRILGE